MIIQNLVQRLRQFRLLHKWISISIVFFVLITGVIPGWKKNVELLQSPTLKGESTGTKWVSFEAVSQSALRAESIVGSPTPCRLD